MYGGWTSSRELQRSFVSSSRYSCLLSDFEPGPRFTLARRRTRSTTSPTAASLRSGGKDRIRSSSVYSADSRRCTRSLPLCRDGRHGCAGGFRRGATLHLPEVGRLRLAKRPAKKPHQGLIVEILEATDVLSAQFCRQSHRQASTACATISWIRAPLAGSCLASARAGSSTARISTLARTLPSQRTHVGRTAWAATGITSWLPGFSSRRDWRADGREDAPIGVIDESSQRPRRLRRSGSPQPEYPGRARPLLDCTVLQPVAQGPSRPIKRETSVRRLPDVARGCEAAGKDAAGRHRSRAISCVGRWPRLPSDEQWFLAWPRCCLARCPVAIDSAWQLSNPDGQSLSTFQ